MWATESQQGHVRDQLQLVLYGYSEFNSQGSDKQSGAGDCDDPKQSNIVSYLVNIYLENGDRERTTAQEGEGNKARKEPLYCRLSWGISV